MNATGYTTIAVDTRYIRYIRYGRYATAVSMVSYGDSDFRVRRVLPFSNVLYMLPSSSSPFFLFLLPVLFLSFLTNIIRIYIKQNYKQVA